MAGLVFLFMSYAPISRMIKSCISYGLGMVSDGSSVPIEGAVLCEWNTGGFGV